MRNVVNAVESFSANIYHYHGTIISMPNIIVGLILIVGVAILAFNEKPHSEDHAESHYIPNDVP